MDVKRLASWNSIAQGDVLSVGKTLVIWSREPDSDTKAVATTAAATAPVASTAVAKESRVALSLVPATLAAADQTRQVTYVVRQGDSLYTIARRFRVTVPKLLEWNEVGADDVLQPGQRLVMFVNVTEQSG